MTSTESKRGLFALMVAHCAGMLDLVALPLWVGTLISQYKFDPVQAGGLATLFLIGASLASVFFASRFHKVNAKTAAVAGFAGSLVAFLICSRTDVYAVLAALHLLGGFCAGTALSFTHGTIGRAGNPHRVFSIVSLAIGIFGFIFLGSMPNIVDKLGGPALFLSFSAVMGAAALAALFFFPTPVRHIAADDAEAAGVRARPIGRAAWYTIIAISLMCTTQSMTLSFYKTIGEARGFGLELVTLALVIYGLVTMLPGPLAGLLEKRFAATTVTCTMPALQAVFALIITHTSNFPLYALGGAMMAFTIIFTHTFAFGLLARLDPSGRATAGTPAMLMIGSAFAPFIGGALVNLFGFEAIGYAAVVIVIIELALYNATRREIAGVSLDGVKSAA